MKHPHLPGLSTPRLLDSKAFVEGMSLVPPAIASGVAVWAASDPLVYWVLLFCACWFVAAAFVRIVHARRQDVSTAERLEHDGLVGALHVLHALAASLHGIVEDAHQRLRITVHRIAPIKGKVRTELEHLEQLTDYVGGHRNGKATRLSIRAGVAGLAARTGEPYWACVTPGVGSDETDKLMVSLGHTASETRTLPTGRCLFIAIPIHSGDDVVGVIYLDSDKPDLFRGEAEVVHWMSCCRAVSRYITWRYS